MSKAWDLLRGPDADSSDKLQSAGTSPMQQYLNETNQRRRGAQSGIVEAEKARQAILPRVKTEGIKPWQPPLYHVDSGEFEPLLVDLPAKPTTPPKIVVAPPFDVPVTETIKVLEQWSRSDDRLPPLMLTSEIPGALIQVNDGEVITVDKHRLSLIVARLASYGVHRGGGKDKAGNAQPSEWLHRDPPMRVIETVIKEITYGASADIRKFARITTHPVLTPEGVVCKSGWDDKTGIVLASEAVVDDTLSPEEAIDIIDSVLVDVAFSDGTVDEMRSKKAESYAGADRAAAYALMLTQLIRYDTPDGLPMLAPMGMISKPDVPGTGASYLGHLISLASIGTMARSFSPPGDIEETRRSITTLLRRSATDVVILDNVIRFGNETWAMLITSGLWTDRKVGSSDDVTVRHSNLWIVTSNDPAPTREMLRRMLPIRLRLGNISPADRKMRMPALEQYIQERRVTVNGALASLVSGWHKAGRPKGSFTLPSFEPWAERVSGILDWAGIKGLGANLPDFYAHMMSEREDWSEFFAEWERADRADKNMVWWTTGDLLKLTDAYDYKGNAPCPVAVSPRSSDTRRSFSRALGKMAEAQEPRWSASGKTVTVKMEKGKREARFTIRDRDAFD